MLMLSKVLCSLPSDSASEPLSFSSSPSSLALLSSAMSASRWALMSAMSASSRCAAAAMTCSAAASAPAESMPSAPPPPSAGWAPGMLPSLPVTALSPPVRCAAKREGLRALPGSMLPLAAADGWLLLAGRCATPLVGRSTTSPMMGWASVAGTACCGGCCALASDCLGPLSSDPCTAPGTSLASFTCRRRQSQLQTAAAVVHGNWTRIGDGQSQCTANLRCKHCHAAGHLQPAEAQCARLSIWRCVHVQHQHRLLRCGLSCCSWKHVVLCRHECCVRHLELVCCLADRMHQSHTADMRINPRSDRTLR
jgi:hypothetical protein